MKFVSEIKVYVYFMVDPFLISRTKRDTEVQSSIPASVYIRVSFFLSFGERDVAQR